MELKVSFRSPANQPVRPEQKFRSQPSLLEDGKARGLQGQRREAERSFTISEPGSGSMQSVRLPRLERLARLGHAYGLKAMLHCCGGYSPLIPQMIEAGLDGLHAVQPSCKGMDLTTAEALFWRQDIVQWGLILTMY